MWRKFQTKFIRMMMALVFLRESRPAIPYTCLLISIIIPASS